MNFTTAIIHHVDDLFMAESFLTDVLGFNQKRITADGALIENGAIAIRLVHVVNKKSIPDILNLEMQTKNIGQATIEFTSKPEILLIQGQVQISPQRIETYLQGPQGISITLAQEFNEDDLGLIYSLPISLDWDEDAEDCVQQILLQVPIGFRQSARIRVTECAEMLAAEQGLITVDIDRAVLALSQVTPLFQHQSIEKVLKERGINPSTLFQQEIKL